MWLALGQEYRPRPRPLTASYSSLRPAPPVLGNPGGVIIFSTGASLRITRQTARLPPYVTEISPGGGFFFFLKPTLPGESEVPV